MRIYHLSDAHADFHSRTKPRHWENDTIAYANLLIHNTIQHTGAIPSGSVAVINGDLSNNNTHSKALLRVFSETFAHVLVVFGNHDYYLESKSIENKFKKHSRNRTDALQGDCQKLGLTNVQFLDNTCVTIDNIRFFGSTMWYPLSDEAEKQARDTGINDMFRIKGLNINLEHEKCVKAYHEALFDTENPLDIAIVHVPITPVRLHQEQGILCRFTPVNGLAPLTLQGHCHEQSTYTFGDKIQYMNAIGYGQYDSHARSNALRFHAIEYTKEPTN